MTSTQTLSFKQLLGVYLKGFAMGAADIVPGVSGGTIAFITGIYQRLISAISRVDLTFIKLVLSAKWRQAWQYIDATFLLALFIGILSSVFTLANVVSYLLAFYPLLVWSFFVGLVTASGIVLLLDIKRWNALVVVIFSLGIVAALLINQLRPVVVEPSLLYVFVCGMIAICAMLLPGVSGSFLLLVFGIYAHLLNAVKSFDLMFIAVLACGAVIGMLSFAKLLNWAMATIKVYVFALLTGFLFGSINLIWPWKIAGDTLLGDEPVMQNVLPQTYAAITGNPSHVLVCISLLIIAMVIVLLTGRIKKE